jgi:hypothetical protein
VLQQKGLRVLPDWRIGIGNGGLLSYDLQAAWHHHA